MDQRRIRILFAGGGTGGHLFPALAIADEIKLRRPDCELLFIGTKQKLEARVVPLHGYKFRTIWISGFHRGLRLENVLFPLKLVVATIQSFVHLRRFMPHVVVGTGGYVSGPVLYAASRLGIPTVVHESNSFPGVTTRALSARATKVLITFEDTRCQLRRTDNVELVGNPIRAGLSIATREEAAAMFGLVPEKPTLLVFGGSLGATTINLTMETLAMELIAAGIQIIWQTGKVWSSARSPLRSPMIWSGDFIERMDLAYAAADLVLCRAGATTLAELTAIGKPAILVPFPHAAADHQTRNARVLVDAGAATMITDDKLRLESKEMILKLIGDPAARSRMSENSKRLGRPEAGKVIAQKILDLVPN